MPPPGEDNFYTLFESEPELLDAALPWVYNTATYRLERDDRLVSATISPSYATFEASISRRGQAVAEVSINAFTAIEISLDQDREVLIIRFGELSASAVYLTLKPTPSLIVAVGSDV